MAQTILVPLDGSPGSEAVLTAVEPLARADGATVRLLYVAPPVEAVVVDGHVVRYADQEILRARREAHAYLVSAAAMLSVAVELVVRFGDPTEEIVREAKRPRVDLVAMATRRRTGLPRLLERSVATSVQRATETPVLLVRYGAPLGA
jgi:nucleotide-binding universal stress UspA family protein